MRTCPECQNSYDDEIIHCPEDGLDLSHIEPQDELIGRSIGSYQIVKVLGKGGMGAVYLAQHPVIGSRVAIKFLLAQYSTDKKIVDRFFNEAKAVNVIGHDNILKILDLSVTEDNRHYFIMEFLNGKPLQDHVKPNEPMTLEVALPILLQTCEALQAAHDHQIIHRDLKPDNVYLITHKGKKNFVKVVDFGIAKLTDAQGVSTGKTQTGMVMGTPAYMSPEQAGGMTSMIDGRSDIYSLGVMMYQMLTGKLPFPGSSFGEVLIGHLQLPPPPPCEVNPNLPPEVEAIILKTLEKKQTDRYQSMREFHDAILEYMNAAGIPNELPAADATEMAQPAVIKLPSSPGTKSGRTASGQTAAGATRNMRSSQPGAKTASGKSNPNARKSQPQVAPPPPPPAPPKSNVGLWVGISVGVVALLGVGGYIWHDQQEKATAEVARLQREAKAKEEAARIAHEREEQAKREAAQEPVAIAVSSDPSGATIVATWKEGSTPREQKSEQTFMLKVPKLTTVKLTASKAGFIGAETEVVANEPKPVILKLTPQAVEKPKVEAVKHVVKKKDKPKDDVLVKDSDSTIPVDFGD